MRTRDPWISSWSHRQCEPSQCDWPNPSSGEEKRMEKKRTARPKGTLDSRHALRGQQYEAKQEGLSHSSLRKRCDCTIGEKFPEISFSRRWKGQKRELQRSPSSVQAARWRSQWGQLQTTATHRRHTRQREGL